MPEIPTEYGRLEYWDYSIFVPGRPAPQGSKRGFYNKKTERVQLVESSAKVKPWREAVKYAVHAAAIPMIEGALEVDLVFVLPRPKSHYGTGTNAGKLKRSAPTAPAVRPDLDKLIRSTLDGLDDAGIFEDDSRVVRITAEKRYAGKLRDRGEWGYGCRIQVRELR